MLLPQISATLIEKIQCIMDTLDCKGCSFGLHGNGICLYKNPFSLADVILLESLAGPTVCSMAHMEEVFYAPFYTEVGRQKENDE